MKPRITIRPRKHTGDAFERERRHAGFFGQLPFDRRSKRLAPFERATRQRPFAIVGATHQQPSTLIVMRRRADPDDRTLENMATDLFQDVERAFWKNRERGKAHDSPSSMLLERGRRVVKSAP